MPHVLLLEEDADYRHDLDLQLRKEGFTLADCAHAGEALVQLQALSAGRGTRADAALLGLARNGGGGLEVLQAIRADPGSRSLPVILVVENGDDVDRLLGLDIGADDVLARPCSARELVARLKGLLRRASFMDGQDRDRVLRFGPIEVDLEQAAARVEGASLELTRREFELLAFFLRNPRRVLSREKILNQVWGLGYLGESRTIDAHVRRLRHKLGASASQIETLVGIGYRLGGAEPGEQ